MMPGCEANFGSAKKKGRFALHQVKRPFHGEELQFKAKPYFGS
jgi:hypothetical protein